MDHQRLKQIWIVDGTVQHSGDIAFVKDASLPGDQVGDEIGVFNNAVDVLVTAQLLQRDPFQCLRWPQIR